MIPGTHQPTTESPAAFFAVAPPRRRVRRIALAGAAVAPSYPATGTPGIVREPEAATVEGCRG